MTNPIVAKKFGDHTPLSPREVAEAWFSALQRGKLQDARALLD